MTDATIGVLKFGTGSTVYNFPNTVNQFEADLSRFVKRSDPLPGVSGGYDRYGYGAAPAEPGRVVVRYFVSGATAAAVSAQIDAAQAMLNWGKQKLYYQPFDAGARQRWTWAAVSAVEWEDEARRLPHKQQEIKVTFEVPTPLWWAKSSLPLWGTGVYGTALYGGGADTSYSGTSATISTTNAGVAPSAPVVALITSTTQVVTAPIHLERLVSATVVERVTINTSLANQQVLLLDCGAFLAKINGTWLYDTLASERGYWLSVQPGANSFRVRSAGASDACLIQIRYDEAYYR